MKHKVPFLSHIFILPPLDTFVGCVSCTVQPPLNVFDNMYPFNGVFHCASEFGFSEKCRPKIRILDQKFGGILKDPQFTVQYDSPLYQH